MIKTFTKKIYRYNGVKYMKTDIEIAQEAKIRPIKEIAESVGLEEKDIYYYGPYKAKVNIDVYNKLKDKKMGN